MEEANKKGVYYCGLVKISHKECFRAMVEKSTKEWPGGSYLIMKSNPIVNGYKPEEIIVRYCGMEFWVGGFQDKGLYGLSLEHHKYYILRL